MRSWARFNWRLYTVLLFTGLLPTIYTTSRIHFLGDLPSEWGVNIASQLAWVNLMLEVVQEALILPLFFLLGSTLHRSETTINKVKTGLVVTLGLYATAAGAIIAFAPALVAALAQAAGTIDATVAYIRWEMIGAPLANTVRFLAILFILLDWRKNILMILVLQMGTSLVLDALLLSQLSFSLNVGVNGIAYSNIVASIVTLAYALTVFIRRYGVAARDWVRGYDFSWMVTWWRVGAFSGIDSLVRNAFYLIFIIRMMNVVHEQGTYWVANGFIWAWLLLPIFPLAELMKQDTARPELLDHKEKTLAYFAVGFGVCSIWVLTIPVWDKFFTGVLNVPDANQIMSLVLVLLPFYVLFAFNTLADSVFYGKGRTEFLAIQSIITNIVVYGGAYLLFLSGSFTPTLTGIALLFGVGILVDSAITFGMYARYVRRAGYRL